MSTITDIKQALADRLATIDGLNTSRAPLAIPVVPFASVSRDHTEWDVTGSRGTDLHTFKIDLLVALTSDKGAQDLLDEFADPFGDRSIKAALEARVDDDLSDLIEDLRVTETGRDAAWERSVGDRKSRYLGTEFTVEVYVPGH